MKSFFLDALRISSLVVVGTIAFFSSIALVMAYNAPTASPSGGAGVTPPVNTGSTAQTKGGTLGAQNLTATGGVVANGTGVTFAGIFGPNNNQQLTINPNSSNNILMQATAAGAGQLRIGSSNAVILQPTAGVVGIRTLVPTAGMVLDVNGATRINGNLTTTGILQTGANRFVANGFDVSTNFWFKTNGAEPGSVFMSFQGVSNGNANSVTIAPRGAVGLFVNSSGNVGIRTAAPGVALDVNGQIRAAAGSGFCIGGSCISSWASAGTADGNDTSVKSNTGNYRVVAGALGCGIPTALNGCGVGTGYNITRPAAGHYVITFSPCFTGWPRVTASPVNGLAGDILKIRDLSHSNCAVEFIGKSYDPNTSNADSDVTGFDFIAVGPQ